MFGVIRIKLLKLQSQRLVTEVLAYVQAIMTVKSRCHG